MALELAAATCARPVGSARLWRILSAYRRAQEDLRRRGGRTAATAQIEAAAASTGLSPSEIAPVVDEWMFRRPLKHLARCRAKGLDGLLDFLAGRGLMLGVLSDYPPQLKLQALGVSDRFSLALCSTDPAIGALKPSPEGFLHACREWRVEPREVLAVGDRVSVDAAGAAAAGMPCVIVGASQSPPPGAGFVSMPSLERLHRTLAEHR
jgi:HAD superfamily hydrolase (TIGR01549 family)